jgi:hypothetical protein
MTSVQNHQQQLSGNKVNNGDYEKWKLDKEKRI